MGDGFVIVNTNATSVTITNVTDVPAGANVTFNVTVDGVHKAGSKVTITIVKDDYMITQSAEVDEFGHASVSFVFEWFEFSFL